MTGRARLASVAAPYAAQEAAEKQEAFKGLMALLAAIELALVDLRTGRSMHSPAAKDFNIDKAVGALETGLRDFRRNEAASGGVGPSEAGFQERRA